MITISINGVDPQEKAKLLNTLEKALVEDPKKRHVAVFRSGAVTKEALYFIPSIVTVYILEE
jgi:hypothetical protein